MWRADGIGVLYQNLDGRLVIQNHPGLDGGFALGRLAVLDQLARIEPRIGVPSR